MKNILHIPAAALLAVSLMAIASSPVAHAAGVALKTEQFQEVEVVKAGKKQKQLKTLTDTAPGDEVVYVTTWHNTEPKKAADNIVIRNPVSPQLAYKAGSAEGAGMQIDFSVDGGKQFGALESLTVTAADGGARAATPADVNVIRWRMTKPAAPGAKGSVSFRAIVR